MSHPRPQDDSATVRADAAVSTPSGDSIPTAFDPNVTSMLGPPQRADELGRLGEYRVLRILGRGGMGAVFEAEDIRLGRRVALKVMLPSLAAAATARDRFTREARAAASVEHDHIVPIYQVGEHNGVAFLAMPLLRGETLDDRLKRDGTIPVAELVVIGRQLADGLAAAHAKGLVHRDVKPSNVWLERTDEGAFRRARLLDFGLARPREDDTAITGSGAVLGTPAFMSPEQARSEAVDHRSDLFSLGSVLYQMATGQRPFRGKDTFAVLTSLAVDTPPDPASLKPAVPPDLSDLIVRMLAKDPGGRPQSAKAVSGELVQIGTALTLTDVEPGTASPASAFAEIDEPTQAMPVVPRGKPGSRSRSLWTVGLAALGLVVVVAGVLMWRASRAKPEPPPDDSKPVVKSEPGKKETTKPEPAKKDPPPGPGLFNGADLAGWTGQVARWQWNPAAGEITAGWPNPTARAGPATLASDRTVRDFELTFRVDVGAPAGRASQGYRSAGLYFRAAPVADRPGGWAGPFLRFGAGQWGTVYDDRAGVVAEPPADPKLDALIDSARTTEIRLRVTGNHVAVSVNGTETTNADFPDLPATGNLVWYLGTPPDGLAVRDIRFTDLTRAGFPPLDPAWADEFKAASPDDQVVRLGAALRQRNPKFDPVKHLVVTFLDAKRTRMQVKVASYFLADPTPLAAVPPQSTLHVYASGDRPGALIDLGPLRGAGFVNVYLRRTPVADLSPLVGMPNLKKLVLEQTAVDAAGVARFKAARPDCEVTWDEPAVTDLLPLVDPVRDAVRGTWERREDALVVHDTGVARLEIPYPPPEEYDFEAEFTRIGHASEVALIVTRAGRQVKFMFGRTAPMMLGFFNVDGKQVLVERPDLVTKAGKRYKARVEVRRDRIMAYLDGQKVGELNTDGSDLSLPANSKLRDPARLGLVANVGGGPYQTIFHAVRLKAVGPPFFNGKDLTGWDNYQKDGSWAVEKGELVCTRPAGNTGRLALQSDPLPNDYLLTFAARMEGRAEFVLRFRTSETGGRGPDGVLWIDRETGQLFLNKDGKWTNVIAGSARAAPGPDGYTRFSLQVVGSKVTWAVGDGPAREVEIAGLPPAGRLEWHVEAGCDRLRIRNLKLTDLTKK